MIDKFYWFEAGYCTMIDRFARRGGGWHHAKFPGAVGLLHHRSEGWILFDTGYSVRFFEATKQWPYRLMRYATRVHVRPEDSVAFKLKQAGIDARSINHIILSHGHTDHVAGVADFENAKLWLHEYACDNLATLQGMRAVKQGVVPALMPLGWQERSKLFKVAEAASHEQFGQCWDMLGDSSILLVDLPGHARGQVGAVFTCQGKTFLLAADAAWNTQEIETQQLPPFPGSLVIHDKAAYGKTLSNLNAWQLQHPDASIIPTHCMKAFNRHQSFPGVV